MINQMKFVYLEGLLCGMREREGEREREREREKDSCIGIG